MRDDSPSPARPADRPATDRPGGRATRAPRARKGAAAVALPVVAIDPRTGRKRSRAGRWRAYSLAGVHLLMIGHYLHWVRAGRTLTPVEPSEAMDTLRAGEINMGFLFFAAALLATFVLGRWVCGWACHLVAYQDLTLWVLRRLRLRPKAFRTRFMVFIPLLAAVYMFVVPLVERLWLVYAGHQPPKLTWHLARTGFWDTFPGPLFAILTVLSCGVAIVYFLGPKGFCTYACPYGGFFALTDRLAPARIRVTDACRECGHCTAACTSNVRVAEEVKLYGMVVDPGCMKCFDCVQTCPSDALYFGFGRPSLGARPAAPRRALRYDMSLGEEIAALFVFLATFLSVRGLYSSFPFLMSLGIAGIMTYLCMKAARLFYARDVLLQKLRLKSAGRLRPLGVALLVGLVPILGLTVHSGVWRYHDFLADLAFDDSPAEAASWQYDPGYAAVATERQRAAVRSGVHHLEFCDSWGFVGDLQNHLQLAWLYLFTEEPQRAAARLRAAIELSPRRVDLYCKLAKVETFLGRTAAAREAFETAIALETEGREALTRKVGTPALPESAEVWSEWGVFLFHQGDREAAEAAEAAWRTALELDPHSIRARIARADSHFARRDLDAARRTLLEAYGLAPHDREVLSRLDSLRAWEPQDFEAAVEEYRRALAQHPDPVIPRHNLAHALTRLRRYAEADAAYRDALQRAPGALQVRFDYGAVLLLQRDLEGVFREYEHILATVPANDRARLLIAETGLRLAGLYAETAQRDRASRALAITLKYGNDPQRQGAERLSQRLRQDPITPRR